MKDLIYSKCKKIHKISINFENKILKIEIKIYKEDILEGHGLKII